MTHKTEHKYENEHEKKAAKYCDWITRPVQISVFIDYFAMRLEVILETGPHGSSVNISVEQSQLLVLITDFVYEPCKSEGAHAMLDQTVARAGNCSIERHNKSIYLNISQ